MERRTLTIPEFANLMGLSKGSAYKAAREGQIPGVIKLGERTVYRRLKDPAFRRQISDTRARMVDEAVGKLTDASSKAVGTLKALLDSPVDPTRLGAAKAILEIGTKLRAAEELEDRIAQMEATVAESANR
jgi:hypothetical protein